MLRRILKIVASIIGVLVFFVICLYSYVRVVSKTDPPSNVPATDTSTVVLEPKPGLKMIGHNWFRHSESGLYELYVEGAPFQRGYVNGKLTKDLVRYQEDVFTDQIRKLVPGRFYLKVLTNFVGWFNRDLADNIVDEYKLEIYGVSQSASHDYDDIASPYQRILNYHAAHDIGHALQNMSLVGCTSFATWGSRSEDSSLIVGRNFDFYVGDDFARDKIIAFYRPEQGYGFMMVTFGGMTGVVSGMNEQGLTVTINAAKSEIPSASATPVSLVAREILQYASTIPEAYAIAEKRKMFVSESFLIGSAKEHRASIIEKTQDGIDLFESDGEQIISTNHFQGSPLGDTQLNKDHMKTSASPYRYQRVAQLLLENQKNSITKTAAVLRNQKGLDNADIGMGNEKLINQLVAHHGIIFQPEKGLVWISTAPWQLGKFVCYDLKKILQYRPLDNKEIYEQDLTIPADSFLMTKDYRAYVKFGKYRFPFSSRAGVQPDSLIHWNPNSYHAYMIAGDYYFDKQEWSNAASVYGKGLTKEVATVQERDYMALRLETCKTKLK
ncbi:MAG: C45 family peptidase [Chryseolinea sp.]